jgi:serine/threonine protein kinase
MALTSGIKLGPYEIQSPLGAGGMGEVYRARDTRLDRIVAIKVLNSTVVSSPELKQRFEREARIISRLNHPHICTLHDVGHQDGTDFLVMEYLEGETLAQRLMKGALAVPDLLKISIDILDGLEQAHRAGVVHRDLKPGNVMLTKAGAWPGQARDGGHIRERRICSCVFSGHDIVCGQSAIAADNLRGGARDRAVHGTRAISGQGGGCAQRYLCLWLDVV